MRTHEIRGVVFLGAALLMSCGGSSTTTGLPTNLVLNGTFSAVINGTAWSPIGRVVVLRVAGNGIGISAVSTTYGMTFAINAVTAPGTYSVAPTGLQGSQVQVSTASGSGWVSNNAGGSGSITFTTVAANRIAGTFVFDGAPLSGTTGVLHVTNGVFDVTF